VPILRAQGRGDKGCQEKKRLERRKLGGEGGREVDLSGEAGTAVQWRS
jgi:hypothetical protein